MTQKTKKQKNKRTFKELSFLSTVSDSENQDSEGILSETCLFAVLLTVTQED